VPQRTASDAIRSFIHEYAQRYSARDVDGVTELCRWPFVAIRDGAPTHLANRDDVHAHFAAMIEAYRVAGYASFSPVVVRSRWLGKAATFTTVRWHALDKKGGVARDSETTYHLLAGPDGWRMLSYTNHF